MINRPLKTLLFHFLVFRFSKFQRVIVKNLMKKPPNFIVDFKSSYKVLVYYKFLWAGLDLGATVQFQFQLSVQFQLSNRSEKFL